MATRDTPFAPGTPCWVDLLSSDVEKSTAFYGELFGWTATAAPEEFGGYVTFASDGKKVAGMMGRTPDMGSDHPDVWSTYIATADIDATVAAAVAAGAQVYAPAMAVGDLGSMALLGDPAGGAFGVWQAGTHTGFERYNEPVAVTWDEYHSKNFEASADFYSKVFGWTMESMGDSDEFRYSTGSVNGESVAGMMDSSGFLPAEVPSHWAVYFTVPDCDAAVAKAVEMGATVTQPAQDTPFGRMASLNDATGAPFKLHGYQAPTES